jgi:hypothetical protein
MVPSIRPKGSEYADPACSGTAVATRPRPLIAGTDECGNMA